MIKVVILGAAGRMGKANIQVFSQDNDVKIIGAVENKNSPYLGKDAGNVAGIDNLGIAITSNLEDCLEEADVVIDFTNKESTLKNLEIIKNNKKAIVIGTTGFNDDEKKLIQKASETIPIVFSPNMSIGVNLLFYLVRRAAEILGNDFESEIIEIHHNQKKDAPSGTALAFGKIIADAKKLDFEKVVVYGRDGIVGARKRDEIGILAVRIADVVGEHTIIFGGPGERIEFGHKANSRKTFASGALRAAKFVVSKNNGLYSMEDVLNLK